MITKSEQTVLEELYKNTVTELKSIQTMMGKVYDEELALDLNKQAVKLSKLEEKAAYSLAKKGLKPESLRTSDRLKMWSSIQAETLLNTSTSHVANLMIRNNSKHFTNVLKAVKHNPALSKESYELAEEFMDFSESNIRKLNAYLK